MQPILFELFGLKVHAYGVMMAVACASALGIAVRRARREGIEADAVYELATWLFLGGVVGARALYVLVWPQSIRSPLDLLRVWEGGGVFYGCILGGLGGTLLYHRRRPFPFLKMADAVAPGLAAGALFGRIGCHLNGCCHGAVTKAAWGVRFPFGSHAWAEQVDRGLLAPEAAWSLPVHPTQLLAAAAGLVLLVALAAYTPYRRRPGQVMALLMIAYPISRWPVEVLRGDDEGLVGGLTISQLISLGLCAAGVALWVRLRRGDAAAPATVPEPRVATA